MNTLGAVDLTLLQSADPLWRPRTSVPTHRDPGKPSELAKSLGLPPLGFASPLGFWFAPTEAWLSPPPYSLEFVPPARLNPMARNDASVSRVVLTDRRRSGSEPQRMELAIDGQSARLDVDEAAWPEAFLAALLTVATSWRLESLDRSFDRLTDQAREIVARGGRVVDLPRDGRSLILDLPELEGPLTDPTRFVPTRDAARLYRSLCTRLGLFDWRNRIDERAEVLDGILDTFSARDDHRQVIALEILIILLLAADIALSQFFGAWE